MSVSKNERVLIVINYLASGDTDYLYRFIENSARGIIQTTLGDDYDRIIKLYGVNATLAKLIAALQRQGARTSIRRIDLIVMLHGLPGKLEFKDGLKNSSVVRDQIRDLNIQSKLRLVYNTSCDGDSHSVHFISAGFDSAIGSKQVNANAAVEFTPLLNLWQFNWKLSDCLAPTIPFTAPSDTLARVFGHANNTSWKDRVDSTKVIRGNNNLQIST